MQSSFLLVALLAFVPLSPPVDLRSSLDAYTAAHPYASLIVGVVDGSSTKVYTAAGTAARLPNLHSTYQIGSITKTFTATLLATMVRDGSVKLQDPIAKYLPAGMAVPSLEGKSMTLLSLAEQNSGLPRLPPNFSPQNDANPYAEYTIADLYDGLEQTKLATIPGERYEYSNFGVTLLGQLLANRMHASYAALVQARVLKPLGMNETVVRGTPQSRGLLVPGYDTNGTRQPAWDFGSLGAAGAIESDMHDMLAYLKANVNAPAGVLGGAMAQAQRPRVFYGVADSPRIGLIWMTNPRSGFIWHNGETGGYHAFIGFNPATRRGLVLLGNVADLDLDRLAIEALGPYLRGNVN